MKFFTKKKFLYKLITCLCLVLIWINFLKPPKIYAAEDDDDGSGIGGILLSPICDLMQGLGDGIMNILQKSIMGTKATIAVDNSDPDWKDKLKKAAIILIGIALVVVAAIFAPGILAVAVKAISGQVIKAVVTFGIAGMVFGFDNVTNRSGCC